MARLAYRMELALRVLWSGDYWTAHVNELLREREASEYRIARVGYEATIARIDLANMNRWRERALSAERKVEQFQKIVRQRGPRPLRLP
jgi:hypothetical protein